jgi:putative ABC transport system permease protein
MPKLFLLAWRNLQRNHRRNLVMGSTIFLGGLVLLCSLFMADGVADGIIRNLVAIESGAVLVQYDARAPALRAPATMVALHQRVLKSLEGMHATVGIRTRLRFEAMLVGPKGDSMTLSVKGIEAEREPELRNYLVPAAGKMIAAEAPEVMISQQVAAQLHLLTGDRVTILVNTFGSQLNALDFTVSGVFTNVAPWVDYVAFVPLPLARSLYTAEASNQYLLDTDGLGQAALLAQQVKTALAQEPVVVRNYHQAGGFLLGIANANRYTFMGFSALLFIVVAIGVASLIGITIRERSGELGTMMALGFEGRQLMGLLIVEVQMLAALSTMGVMVAAFAIYVTLSVHGIELHGVAANAFGAARLAPSARPYQLLVTAAACMLMPLLGTFIPARRVLRMSTDDILRKG